jgi:parallel beta-helix repeat protein
MITPHPHDAFAVRPVALAFGVSLLLMLNASGAEAPPATAAPGASGPTVSVGPAGGKITGADSLAIQKALDAVLEQAPKGGGMLLVKAGTYTLYNSIYVRGPVTLRGEGARTVLKKAPQYVTALAQPIEADAVELDVKEIGPIRAGWGFSLNPGGPWVTSIRTAVAVNGNRITMDRPRNREFKYPQGKLAAGAKLQTSFPLIQILGVEGVVLEDLVFDGNLAENPDMVVEGCRSGGIYLCSATPGQQGGQGKHVVRRCVMRDFAGDGISWQGPADVLVEEVEAFGNKGHGLHPGTNALHTVIRNCKLHHNAGDGLYVCWDVQHARFENNVIEDNEKAGISIGHGDTDSLYVGNQIRRNKGGGIAFRKDKPPPDRCVIQKNVVEDNGGTGISIPGCIAGTILEGNTIRDTRTDESQRTQKTAISSASLVTVKENTVEGDVKLPAP